MKRFYRLFLTTLFFAVNCRVASADDILFNTDTGVMTINGTPQTTFFGVPMQTSVVNGIRQFRFLGDLVFLSSDTVGAQGNSPLSIIAGNDIRTNGATLNFDVFGQTGKLGGGSGGGSVSGGGAGAGGGGGIFGIGGAGGTGAVPLGAASTDGTKGGPGSPGTVGSGGSAGTAGQAGSGGFHNGTGARAAGGAGTAGQPASPSTTSSTGGSGGPKGINVTQGIGGAGQTGGTGGEGSPLNSAGTAGNGEDGLGGLHLTTGLILSGGAGGSAGGSGGGGGGGAGGTGGAGGGGGGGGGVGVFIFIGEGGGNGGLGGFGGIGGQGGNGSAGASSGAGGAGGAAVELVAQGRLSFTGSISVRGATASSRGSVANPQSGSSGSDGIGGFPGGGSATGIGGAGGSGGPGGKGGTGGTGGRGGEGGHGGGGSGGTVMFKSTFLNAAGGTIVTSGGSSLSSAGGEGRYVTSHNGGLAPNFGNFGSSQREEVVGLAARDTNPFVAGGSTITSNLVDLVGGADVYGIKQSITSNNIYFEQIRAGAPVGALAAVVKRTIGPSPFEFGNAAGERYASHEMLMLVNLTGSALALPKLGVGPAGGLFFSPLAERGFLKNPLFGGSGATNLQSLGARQVFATLINSGSGALEVNASLDGDAMATIAFNDLNVSYIVNQRTFGDFSANGALDNLDIAGMLKALVDVSAFKTARGLSDAALLAMGDLNGDNKFTNADIQPLLNLIAAAGGGSVEAVPEPSGLVVAVLGVIGIVACGRFCKR